MVRGGTEAGGGLAAEVMAFVCGAISFPDYVNTFILCCYWRFKAEHDSVDAR